MFEEFFGKHINDNAVVDYILLVLSEQQRRRERRGGGRVRAEECKLCWQTVFCAPLSLSLSLSSLQ